MLLGEAGVGKTAIAEGLAQWLVAGRVPAGLRGFRLKQLDMARLVAGTGRLFPDLAGVVHQGHGIRGPGIKDGKTAQFCPQSGPGRDDKQKLSRIWRTGRAKQQK